MKENSLKSFFLSKEFWNQLKIGLASFFAIIFITSIFLHFCTHHNQYLTVPDFKSLTYEEAFELADESNMRISIMDSVYHQDLKPGSVIDQEPKPGTEVKKNRRIFLVLNAKNPEMVLMPDITGVSLRQALAILESNGLQPGRLKYVPDIATNNVLKQKFEGSDIKPGKKIKKGSHISMILGNSGAGPVELPDLTNLTLRTVEKQLAKASLNMGAVIFDNSVQNAYDSIIAVVIKQRPLLNDQKYVNMGSLVDVWLGLKTTNKEQNDIDNAE